jgi:hypothetical protein
MWRDVSSANYTPPGLPPTVELETRAVLFVERDLA